MKELYKYCIYDELDANEDFEAKVTEFRWITEAEYQLNVIKEIDEEEYKYKLDEFIELSCFKNEGSISINGFTFTKEII